MKYCSLTFILHTGSSSSGYSAYGEQSYGGAGGNGYDATASYGGSGAYGGEL